MASQSFSVRAQVARPYQDKRVRRSVRESAVVHIQRVPGRPVLVQDSVPAQAQRRRRLRDNVPRVARCGLDNAMFREV